MKKGIVMEINERFLTILTPEGEFLRSQKLNSYYEIGQEIDFFPVEQEEREKSFFISTLTTFKGKIALTTALAFVLMFISIIPFYQNNQVYAYLSIDINPSLELGINKNYEVVELIPYNEDGKKIVNQLDGWKKKDVSDVTSEIIHEMKDQGYMESNDEVVIATVYAQETIEENDTRWNEEMDGVQAVIHSENLDLTVVEGTREDREKAKEEGLTTGLYKENTLEKNNRDSEKVENPVTVPQKQKELPTKENPSNQEEKLTKTNEAKQNEKMEAKEGQGPRIPPGQLKKEEKADKNVGKVEEVKKEKANSAKQDEKNKRKENNGMNNKEQKTNKNNSGENNNNNSHQEKQQNSANKKLKTEDKGKSNN
ncbi:anti-sigma factor domain-containing protein [Bacillus sp. V3B]|uniref:anti-sigma factor domain-containing protein n=1 Tax=Bacillus sp. V3B TaxID=2804915 RepID=UPI002108ADA6|nr:anti-sigma factor domain-containing protein [Bacillus sp. V3B]MCQ6277350.1 anti-sigma factor domain-containing protein [Bacillus sp. V3B]